MNPPLVRPNLHQVRANLPQIKKRPGDKPGRKRHKLTRERTAPPILHNLIFHQMESPAPLIWCEFHSYRRPSLGPHIARV